MTTRRLQILRLVADGLLNKEIARECHLTNATVRNHLNQIYGILDASNRTEAVKVAREHGFID